MKLADGVGRRRFDWDRPLKPDQSLWASAITKTTCGVLTEASARSLSEPRSASNLQPEHGFPTTRALQLRADALAGC